MSILVSTKKAPRWWGNATLQNYSNSLFKYFLPVFALFKIQSWYFHHCSNKTPAAWAKKPKCVAPSTQTADLGRKTLRHPKSRAVGTTWSTPGGPPPMLHPHRAENAHADDIGKQASRPKLNFDQGSGLNFQMTEVNLKSSHFQLIIWSRFSPWLRNIGKKPLNIANKAMLFFTFCYKG